MSDENSAGFSLANPFGTEEDLEFVVPGQIGYQPGLYEQTLAAGYALQQRPRRAAGVVNIERQHQKDRMTIWERIQVLADGEPTVLFQNWGENLDGASLVTAVIKVKGRDVAIYGHDFTVRAGSMDATNGRKLARLFELAGKRRIPLVGLNDSAGAYVPAGRRRPRRLRRGLHGVAQGEWRGAEHHVHVRLQRRRRLLPAAPGQLRDPAARHLLRPYRSRRREVGARRGCDARGTRWTLRALAVRGDGLRGRG
jgi:hypothetical protein